MPIQNLGRPIGFRYVNLHDMVITNSPPGGGGITFGAFIWVVVKLDASISRRGLLVRAAAFSHFIVDGRWPQACLAVNGNSG